MDYNGSVARTSHVLRLKPMSRLCDIDYLVRICTGDLEIFEAEPRDFDNQDNGILLSVYLMVAMGPKGPFPWHDTSGGFGRRGGGA